jgi:hypothetical protein
VQLQVNVTRKINWRAKREDSLAQIASIRQTNSIEFPSGEQSKQTQNSKNLFYFSHKQTVNWLAIICRWFFYFPLRFSSSSYLGVLLWRVCDDDKAVFVRISTLETYTKARRVATRECCYQCNTCPRLFTIFQRTTRQSVCSEETPTHSHIQSRCKALKFSCDRIFIQFSIEIESDWSWMKFLIVYCASLFIKSW